METEHRLALPKGTVINQYRIDSVLGYGGFGIVYKAQHMRLGNWLAIKEYLPQELATRESGTVHPLGTREQVDFQSGLDRFLAEAKQLVQFENHPNIVNCQDFIEDNGTAYLVMGFEDGLPLSDLLRGRERNNQTFSEDEILRIILPLLRGLAVVHRQHVLHRDIKPGNIFIRRSDEQPVLIDFGAAKQNFTEHSKSMAPYSPGYAAIEQVETDGNLGPWTDIYAIGGVMWRIIARQNPPQVENRMSAVTRNRPDPLTPALELGSGRYSENFLKTIDACLQLNEEDRFQTVQDVIRCLEGEPVDNVLAPSAAARPSANTAYAAGSQTTSVSSQSPPRAKFAVLGIIILLLGAGGAYYAYTGSQQNSIDLTDAIAVNDTPTPDPVTVEEPVSEPEQPEPVQAEPVESEADRIAREQREREAAQRQREQDALNQAIAGLGRMVTIPSGIFDMGDLAGTGDADEQPVHTVFMDSFQMMEHEITQAQWDQCVQAGSCDQINSPGAGRRELRPVTNVSWDQAQRFIDWFNSRNGGGYRLPTEAEWEYAARAGTTGSFHWGNTHRCEQAKLNNCGEAGTTEVKSYAPNDWGIYDMHGNAWEWVQDCARDNYNGAPDDGLEWTGSAGCSRVLRGGGWNSSEYQGRISYRNWLPGNQSASSTGFRLVR